MKQHSVLFKFAAMCMAVLLLVGTLGVIAYAEACTKGGEHEWVPMFDEYGWVVIEGNGHKLECIKCGATKIEEHTFDMGLYYHVFDADAHKDYHMPECDLCMYRNEAKKVPCTYSNGEIIYCGTDAYGRDYHGTACDVCFNVKAGTQEYCSPKLSEWSHDAFYHWRGCEKCGNDSKVWNEAAKKAVGEPHDFQWESEGGQTLFTGNTMVKSCWCGQVALHDGVEMRKNAEELWAEGNRNDVSVDDLSYIHRLGIWVVGTGSFVLRVAFEPIRLIVNMFYHLDMFD